jgi:hypothetical protein
VTATEAALTAPASYDYRYYHDGTRFVYGTPLGTSQAYYVRTADGVYYNYNHGPFDLSGDGLEVSMTFNRSNTAWTLTTPFGYRATDTKIGSDNTVGTITEKLYFKLDNQTKNHYQFYLDSSSTTAGTNYDVKVNSFGYGNQISTNTYFVYNDSPTAFTRYFIPSYTEVVIAVSNTGGAKYFDAWYLKDLGVSSSYQEGYDQGELDGYEDGYNNSASPLWDGLEVAVGVTLNFILFIATLSIFDISLLNIGIVMVSILGLVWVLKALRG